MVNFNAETSFALRKPQGDISEASIDLGELPSTIVNSPMEEEKINYSFSCDAESDTEEPATNRLPLLYSPVCRNPQAPLSLDESPVHMQVTGQNLEDPEEEQIISDMPSLLLDRSYIIRELFEDLNEDNTSMRNPLEEEQELLDRANAERQRDSEGVIQEEREESKEEEEEENSEVSQASSSRIAPVLMSFRGNTRRHAYRDLSQELARREPILNSLHDVSQVSVEMQPQEHSRELIIRDERTNTILRLVPARQINYRGEMINMRHELFFLGRTIIILNHFRREISELTNEEVLQIKLGDHTLQEILSQPQFDMEMSPKEALTATETCSICYSEYLERNKKPSGCPGNHTFHAVCLAKWIQEKRAVICPLCKWARA